MSIPLGQQVTRIRQSVARAVTDGTVALAHRSPRFRDWIIGRLASALDSRYAQYFRDDPETLAFQRWFGRSLRPFLHRLIRERPSAAQALVRLAYTWATDMRRRAEAEPRNDGVSPCTVVIEPTDRCNLNCPGCYAKSTAKGEDMDFATLRDTVAEVQRMGTTLITWSGGEPFLRERQDRAITRLAEEFPHLGFLTYTNGLLIDEETADRLGEVGNVFPAISIEGGEAESDARRGDRYYSQTHRVRQMLAEREVLFGFSATVTRENADLVTRHSFLDSRIAAGDLFGWYFLLQPIGRSPDPSLMVTAEQRRVMRRRLYAYRAQGKPLMLGDFWNDGQLVQGCIAAGRAYFHIYANGDISPCVFCPVACADMRQILDGTSGYRSLRDLVVRHPFFRGYRAQQRQVHDWRAPCLLIDHPGKLRDLCARGHWYPAKNMPDGYLDGDIARAIDRSSAAWHRALATEPRIPPCVLATSGQHAAGPRPPVAATG